MLGSAIVSALPGCAETTPSPIPPAGDTGVAVRASEAGLEVMWWAVDDSQGAVGRALAPFAGGAADDLAPGWRAAGMRLIRVPREKLEVLAVSMPSVGPLQRQSFGMLGAWGPVIAGRAWSGRLTITVSDGGGAERLSLGPGRLRLLARCWSEARLSAEGAAFPAAADLRVEVVPQHEESIGATALVARPDHAARGQVFDTLRASWAAAPGMVYVIVPETPGAVWATVEDASNDRPLGPPVAAEDVRGTILPPTLGEAMLTDAGAGGMARTRIIVALVPRAPERFELIRGEGSEAQRHGGTK